MVVVVADDAVDDAVGGENRKHAAADDAGDAVVAAGVVGGEDLPAGCDVVADAVGDAAVGCTVADDDMEGFVLC